MPSAAEQGRGKLEPQLRNEPGAGGKREQGCGQNDEHVAKARVQGLGLGKLS